MIIYLETYEWPGDPSLTLIEGCAVSGDWVCDWDLWEDRRKALDMAPSPGASCSP